MLEDVSRVVGIKERRRVTADGPSREMSQHVTQRRTWHPARRVASPTRDHTVTFCHSSPCHSLLPGHRPADYCVYVLDQLLSRIAILPLLSNDDDDDRYDDA